jgi:hypothetical protein
MADDQITAFRTAIQRNQGVIEQDYKNRKKTNHWSWYLMPLLRTEAKKPRAGTEIFYFDDPSGIVRYLTDPELSDHYKEFLNVLNHVVSDGGKNRMTPDQALQDYLGIDFDKFKQHASEFYPVVEELGLDDVKDLLDPLLDRAPPLDFPQPRVPPPPKLQRPSFQLPLRPPFLAQLPPRPDPPEQEQKDDEEKKESGTGLKKRKSLPFSKIDYDVKEKWQPVARDAFDNFRPLYPSFSDFLNYLRDREGSDFITLHRPHLTKWYFSQEIVQVFQPPPTQYMLKREKGYYPKLIAFYPFERLYSDTGKIIIYPMTRKEARKKTVPVPTDKKTVEVPTDDGVVPKEARFPPELRNIYKSGKQRSGSSQIKSDSDLAKRRAEFVLQNKDQFSEREVKKAEKGFFVV